MELYLQLGYGMMEHCRHLIESWGQGCVILSPRDLEPEQLVPFSSKINKLAGATVLLDPQFYLPQADHARLCSHNYFPDDYQSGTFWSGNGLMRLLDELLKLNEAVSAQCFILPGLLATEVNENWLKTQIACLKQAASLETNLPILQTIALSADAARDENQIDAILDASEKSNPYGYYIVLEHPGGDYLVEDVNWLANLLDLSAGLKLQGKHVILGYCNHQQLVAAATKADAICSGTWLNVRSFPPEKFRQIEEEQSRRATWYYCPQALSEFKITFLDAAKRTGKLSLMAAPNKLDGGYTSPLFSGAQPTSVAFREPNAFRHYLHALHEQVSTAVEDTFDTTISRHEHLLDTAEPLIKELRKSGVLSQGRSFENILDINRSALGILANTRGPVLRRAWQHL